MELVLQRGVPGNYSIPGEMFIAGAHAVYTLENKLDAIPAGTYRITIYESPHFGRPMPLLLNVPGRSFIEIHWGTYPKNYIGCIGVGEMRDLDTEEIFNTERAFLSLFGAIEQAVDNEGCSIAILN